MDKSENIGQLTAALAKAQAAFLPVKRSSQVVVATAKGQYRYTYAPLSEVFDACRKALADNELAVMQLTRLDGARLILETLLSHSSGEWIKGEMLVEGQGQGPQATGSGLTYARRYALSAMLGIASEEDDDAVSVGVPDKKTQVPKSAPVPADVKSGGVPQAQKANPYLCPQHNVVWFKSAAMRAYAHPMGEGEKWCQMPSAKAQESPPAEGLVSPEPTSGVASAPAPTEPTEMSNEEFRQAVQQLGWTLGKAEVVLGMTFKKWREVEKRTWQEAWERVKAAHPGGGVERIVQAVEETQGANPF